MYFELITLNNIKLQKKKKENNNLYTIKFKIMIKVILAGTVGFVIKTK